MPVDRKARVVWDLDDTLNDLMRSWLAWHLRGCEPARNGPVYEEIRENPPHRLLDLSLEDYIGSLDEFRLSPEAAKMAPSPLVLEWFNRHGFAFEHHILTARPLATVPSASSWLFAHFGRWVRHFHYVPARRAADGLPDMGEGKHDVIARLGGADFLLDDLPENLASAAPVVRTCLLVPQPWNKADRSLESILSVLTSAI